jgi:hypothetical protein
MTALRRRWVGICLLLAFVGTIGAFTAGLFNSSMFVAYADPAGIKYTGSGACAAAACHGAAAAKDGGATNHHENIVWNEKDPHSKAYSGENGLINDKAKEIAKKLGIADATKDGKCLSCHSTSGISLKHGANRIILTAADHGAKFDPAEGVSCDACHGPATKYLEPHTAAGWTAGIRKNGAAKVYDEWGLFDTKDLKFRANTCLSCHLKIDFKMVEAGHPELPFELGDFSSREWIHWKDKGEWFNSKSWAMGQAVSLREAAFQLGDRAKAKADAKLVKAAYDAMIAYALLARQAAAVVDAPSQAAIDAQIDAIHKNWADGAKVDEAAQALAKAAEALADKVDAFKPDKASTEKFRAGVVAEAETAGTLGNFRACETICYSMLTLNGAMATFGGEDAAKLEAEVGKLFEVGSILADFKPADYAAAAKALAAKAPGGKAIPLPAGAPTK